MSMAEAIAVVAETGQAIPAASHAAPRTRISADSFKNLTARLKATGNVAASVPSVVVPSISVAAPIPAQQVIEPAPQPVEPAHAAAALAHPAHMTLPEGAGVDVSLSEIEAAIDDAPVLEAPVFEAPVITTPVLETPTIDVAPLDVPSLDVPEIETPAIEAPHVFAEPSFEPVEAAKEPAAEVQAEPSPLEKFEPVYVDLAKPEPASRPAAGLIERAIGIERPAPQPQRALPELVNPLEVMAAQEAERRAEEERLKAEAEAKAALAPPKDPEEEARKLAELAESRAIENIWRQLLATPTKEDCAAYLREAREEMGEDYIEPPQEEHDLSLIQPADIAAEEQPAEMASAPEVYDERAAPSGEADAPAEGVLPEVPSVLEPDNQDTAEFARSLLDMMAAGSSSGLPHERALAADTLLRLVPRLDLKPLIMLSQRLAMMENPPHLLVAKLIRDPRVDVSGPLLEDCMHITDNDLRMVIDENKPDKLRMIARRRKLSRAISDALIATNDPSVLLTLVRNMEAEISHEGFNTLIEATDANPDILAPLSTRPDLGAPFAFELFWHAPAQLRRYLLTRFLTDSETLSKILKITMATKEEDETSDIEPMSQHVILEALDRAARGKLEPACDELSQALQIDAKTVMRVLSDQQGEPLVILLKAANYSRSAIPGLLRRMTEADFPIISSERDPEDLQSLFDTLSFNKARILLTYWDWAMTKTGPYAPVH